MHRLIKPLPNHLLAALPAADQDLLGRSLMVTDLERGRVLYEPGDPMDTLYFPHDGVISLMTLMENGSAIESATIGREGALGLNTAAAPRLALSRAVCQTPCRCARISAAKFREAWDRSPTIRLMVERHTEALYAHAIQSVACNALHSVEARFARWLLTCHDRISSNTVALTQEFLADMLGVQRTTVTAVARGLQARGHIHYRRGVVDILDRAGLEQLACECYTTVRETYERLLPLSVRSDA